VQNKMIKTGLLMSACVGLGLTATAKAALSPVTFAQFEETTTGANANQFAYIDNGLGGGIGAAGDAQFVTDVGGVEGAAIPVAFQYLTVAGVLPADLQGVQNATLTLLSGTESPVAVLGGVIADQQINGDTVPPQNIPVNVLTITRDNPADEGTGSKTNLLTMVFTGQLVGELGSRTPQLSGNTALGNLVAYSSDFLTFDDTQEKDFSLTYTSWTSADSGGLEKSLNDPYFATSSAAGTGTFDAVALVPEPTTLGLGLVASLGWLAGGRRRR
jgi:hypothetical protein